jgi:hypothetical protein
VNKEKFMRMPGASEKDWQAWQESEKKIAEERERRAQYTEVNPEYWGFDSKDIAVYGGGDMKPTIRADGTQIPPPYMIVQHIPTGFYTIDMNSRSQIKGKIECLRMLSLLIHETEMLKQRGLRLRAKLPYTFPDFPKEALLSNPLWGKDTDVKSPSLRQYDKLPYPVRRLPNSENHINAEVYYNGEWEKVSFEVVAEGFVDIKTFVAGKLAYHQIVNTPSDKKYYLLREKENNASS